MCPRGVVDDMGGFSFVPVLWKRVDGMVEAWMTDMKDCRFSQISYPCPSGFYMLWTMR